MQVSEELVNELLDWVNAYEEDRETITDLILTAKIYITSVAGTNYLAHKELEALEKLLLKKLISDMFDNRSTEVSQGSKQDRITTTILDILSNAEEVSNA